VGSEIIGNYANRNQVSKSLKISLLFILGFTLFYSDFIRDYVFKNLDYQIHYLSHYSADGFPMVNNYTDSLMEKLLEGKSIKTLRNLKWLFTILFSFYFLIFSIVISYIIYKKKVMMKYAAIFYGIIFASALLIYGLRFLYSDYNWQENTYLISLGLMHFLQSSLPTLILVLAFKLHISFKVGQEN